MLPLQDPAALREEGNCLFKDGDFQGALSCYTKALKLSDTQSECAVLHRNRAACYLKLVSVEWGLGLVTLSKPQTHIPVHLVVVFMCFSIQNRGSLQMSRCSG